MNVPFPIHPGVCLGVNLVTPDMVAKKEINAPMASIPYSASTPGSLRSAWTKAVHLTTSNTPGDTRMVMKGRILMTDPMKIGLMKGHMMTDLTMERHAGLKVMAGTGEKTDRKTEMKEAIMKDIIMSLNTQKTEKLIEEVMETEEETDQMANITLAEEMVNIIETSNLNMKIEKESMITEEDLEDTEKTLLGTIGP